LVLEPNLVTWPLDEYSTQPRNNRVIYDLLDRDTAVSEWGGTQARARRKKKWRSGISLVESTPLVTAASPYPPPPRQSVRWVISIR
jgi:hypothetical protein